MYFQTVKQEPIDEDTKKFVPDLVVKNDWKDHSVLVKEATFKDESDDDRDDFDPFSCDFEEPATPPPSIVTKVELKIEKYDPFEDDDECGEIEMLFDEEHIDDFHIENVHCEPEILAEEVFIPDPVIKQEKLETKKNLPTKVTTRRSKKTIIKIEQPDPEEDKIVKPIKKRVYMAKESDDEDLTNFADFEEDKDDGVEGKRKGKGPPIAKDLKYYCSSDACKDKLCFMSSFEFVDHMETAHMKTLSMKRLRSFIPWERLPNAIIRVHPDKLPKIIRCKKCLKVYSGQEGLKRHLQVGNCDSVKENYVCKICYAEFKRSDLRRVHMQLEHPVEHSDAIMRCLICDDQCESKQGMADHYRDVHDNNFSCNFCLKDFKWAKSLLEHMRSQHMNIGLICDICGKVLRCIKELKCHKEIHNVELTVKCTDCDLMFASQIKMKYHWENIHNPGEFICEICSKSYTTKMKLHKHKYEAHTEKNYRCHLCGKGFIRNGELSNHMLWHEGKWKPKKKIRTLQNKEKIYKCELCDMKTARAYNLKKHVRHVHLGEKRMPKNPQDFYCEICQKGFSESRNYKKHMSRKSVHLVYKCDKCSADVLGLINFRQHKKEHP